MTFYQYKYQLKMNTLPSELIMMIFTKLPFSNIMKFICIFKELCENFLDFLPCLTIPKFIISKYENYQFLIKYQPKIRILKINTDRINEDIIKMDFTMIKYEKIFLNCAFVPGYFYEDDFLDIKDTSKNTIFSKHMEILKQYDSGFWKINMNCKKIYFILLELCSRFESFIVRTLIIDTDFDILNIDFTKLKYERLHLRDFCFDDVSGKMNITHTQIWKYEIKFIPEYIFLFNSGCEIKTLIIENKYHMFALNLLKYKKLHLLSDRLGFTNDIRIMDPNIAEKCKGITISNTKNCSDTFINSLTHLKLCESFELQNSNNEFYSTIAKLTKTLPKLRKFKLSGMTLKIKDLELLSGYENIVLKHVALPEDWNINALYNNSHVRLKACILQLNVSFISKILYGNRA